MSRTFTTCFALLLLCAGLNPTGCFGLRGEAEPAKPQVAGPQRIDPELARRELRSILSEPEYNRGDGKSVAQVVMEKVVGAIVSAYTWIKDMLTFQFGGGAGRLASFLFAWSVVCAFIYLLLLLIRRLSANLRSVGRAAEDADIASYDLPSAGPLMNEAAKLADAGDYRGAFRCAYLASISYLDEIKALRFERSRTNWEYLRELDQGGFEAPRAELGPLTSDFDRKFYGREPCSRQDYLNALTAYERICQVNPA